MDRPIIRKYVVEDREAVRRLCCETGFLGNRIDPVFVDREVFADFLTDYYLEREPESAFVVERDGDLRGYLLGCCFPRRHAFWSVIFSICAAGRLLLHFPGYNEASQNFVRWMIFNAWREVPPAPAGVPHFHINLLEDVRNVSTTRQLIDSFLEYLKKNGASAGYGQMVTSGSRRSERMFQRYGFAVLNRSEITKYQAFYPETVYLCTVLKDLRAGVRLYER